MESLYQGPDNKAKISDKGLQSELLQDTKLDNMFQHAIKQNHLIFDAINQLEQRLKQVSEHNDGSTPEAKEDASIVPTSTIEQGFKKLNTEADIMITRINNMIGCLTI